MRFYLGTHEPAHMGRTDVPLFLSRVRLFRRKSLPRAGGPWALDSGGFSELSLRGTWTVTAEQYAGEVRRFAGEIGRMEWAAVQDWMCEPHILRRTGLTVEEHQRRTVESYLRLMEVAPDLPWAPVLQGWAPLDYLRHAEQYHAAGVDLATLPIVGVGSVCRRQAGSEAARILWQLSLLGVRLHGFGLKLQGLTASADVLASSDSMAWSYSARRNAPLPGCTHRSCANCLGYALRWRKKVLATVARTPLTLFAEAA